MSFSIHDTYVCLGCKQSLEIDEKDKPEGYEDYTMYVCSNPNCYSAGVLIYDD